MGVMQPDPVPVISFQRVTKRYGALTAVSELSLDVYPGEVFGYLGLNGAGKTTSIRMLLDLIRPTRGAVYVSGYHSRAQTCAVRSMVGYMPGEIGLYGDLTGTEILRLLSRLQNTPTKPEYRAELLERFRLTEAQMQRRVREYSTGMKRKLGLIQAFQGDPPVLILDEPTEGLDPLMQEAFYVLLAELRARGRTIFLSSHVLSEVERVCTRVGLLRTGELVLNSSVDEVREMAPRRVRILFSRDVPEPAGEVFSGCELQAASPREWRFRTNGPLGPVVERIAGLPVYDILLLEPRLEDILIEYYKESDR
jgi:ABC-2 type transport system ATP-binding protein